MKFLVLGSEVLGAQYDDILENEDAIFLKDSIFPKSVIEGFQIVTAELPSDCAPSDCEYLNGEIVPKLNNV